jgi:hypothetical protein
VHTTILVDTGLVLNIKKSKELIVEYVRQLDGKATKNKVAYYMEKGLSGSNEKYGVGRVYTFDLLDDLVKSGRIKEVKSEAWRQGQAIYLMVNDDDDYRWLDGQIENIGIHLHDHPETKERMINLLIINLQRANKYIKSETDRQALVKRIVDELLKIRYKKAVTRRGNNFVDEIKMPWGKD